MKKKIAILGYGMRGGIYAGYAAKYPEEFEVAAIVDNDPEKLKLARARFGCPAYSDIRSFLADGIAADIAAICTQDAQHKEHAVRCMQAGYDLLLEKPIAASPEDCLAIEAAAEKYERRVIVCHVLRYTPFYRKIKEIVSSGKLGKIMTLCATENVGYYHQAHSFVRGPWRNSADSCPMILAKCCHDLDIIRWLVGEKCTEVSSFGSLGFFTLENAPAESAAYCSDCP
ncbi:MAG: Gfo/Idh/MocA family protein, partial [Eubacteriales bacterium]